jgi:hypothetical protein
MQLNAMDVVQMTPCDGTAESEMWCCGETRDCCDHGKALVVPKVLGMKSNSSSSTNVIGFVSPTASSAMRNQTFHGMEPESERLVLVWAWVLDYLSCLF